MFYDVRQLKLWNISSSGWLLTCKIKIKQVQIGKEGSDIRGFLFNMKLL